MSRRARTLVVACVPDPESFNSHLRDTVVAAATERGDEVRLTDLYAEGFRPEMTCEERRNHKEPGASESIRRHADDLAWCTRLIFVYPTWWSAQPAMLKGWMDRVLVRDVAWYLPAGGNRITGRLQHIDEITVVTTHGSSKLINSLEGEAGKRTLFRTLRALTGLWTRTRWIAMYRLDRSSPADRAAFVSKVHRAISR